MTQPGYDALAQLYSDTFPSPYLTALERHVIAAFADLVRESGLPGPVLDVGCGLGQVTADLANADLDVIGVDPSREMLRIAAERHPGLTFVVGDASLAAGDLVGIEPAAVLARFSLIHVPPDTVLDVLADWAARMRPGSHVALAGQTTDSVGEVVEFDHRVAPAWRWHPDRVSEALSDAGFDELWRTVSRPDADHRFPDFHLVARRR